MKLAIELTSQQWKIILGWYAVSRCEIEPDIEEIKLSDEIRQALKDWDCD